MRLFFLASTALLAATIVACGQESSPSTAKASNAAASNRSPLEVVNARMTAYNAHDLDAFLEVYADEVTIFTYPDRSLGGGVDHLRSIFEPMFKQGEVQVTLEHQIAKDSYVVNHETVVEGDSTTEYVSIYEVQDGLIQSVRFVRD